MKSVSCQHYYTTPFKKRTISRVQIIFETPFKKQLHLNIKNVKNPNIINKNVSF